MQEIEKATRLFKSITGQQYYHVTVPGNASAALLSVVSFDAVEALGEPYRIVVQLTHPQELDRTDYLGKEASFKITPPTLDVLTGHVKGTQGARTFSGCITHFRKCKQTRDFHSYEFIIEPLVARLRQTHASRVFQKQTAPQIIETILRRHGFNGNQFLFTTRRTYVQHDFHLQYQMNDWNYIHLLMRQEGLYSYFTPGKFGDIIVFGDDVDHYIYKPELKAPYREIAGLDANTETILSLQTQSQIVPASYHVADYRPTDAWERFKEEANIAHEDTTTYGQPYVYGSHHLDRAGAKFEAQLRHEAAIARQIVYTGESNLLGLHPARILQMDHSLPDAPHGQMIVSVTHSGARDTAYKNSYTAIPSDRRFRLQLDETNWPKIAGTLSARVTSPGNYPHAYITKDGHYTVRFDLDFDEWNPGGESVPLRLAKPFAGANETGFHFPIIDGTEAAIAFMDGNPNKPYIAHLHHNSRHPDHINGEDRWLSRNVIRTQSNNKLRMEDWKGVEHIKLSTEHSGKSQLNLGHLVDSQRQERGQGIELRTDAHAAIRGGRGVFLSADAQTGAQGKQLDMQEAKAQLDAALNLMQVLTDVARTARAHVAEVEQQKYFLEQRLDKLEKSVILLSAPEGIALASGNDLQLAAQGNATITANQTDIGVLKKFTVAAGEAVSLFAHKLGIKLFAAKGRVEIQAQSDDMALTADKNMTMTSINGRITVEAKEEILFKCGGSYIRISATGIEDGTKGDRIIKSASLSRQGPAALAQHLNSLPKTAFDDPYVLRNRITGEELKNQAYEIIRSDGSVVKGVSDGMGRTSVQKGHGIESVAVRILTQRNGENG